MYDTASPLGVASCCHHNVRMADWQRLGKLIVDRRIELGYRRREDLGADLGVSLRTLGDIEVGRRDKYHPNTIASLENALQWAPGSIDTVLAGGEPTPRTPPQPGGSPLPVAADPTGEAGEDPLIKIMDDDRLTPAQKAQIIRQLIAEQQTFAQRRADELLRAYQQQGE